MYVGLMIHVLDGILRRFYPRQRAANDDTFKRL